jgi:tripartite-type tricarboxylate transporter receptor subunit TctC
VVFNNKSTQLTHYREGKLKALAVTSERRWPELLAVPTMGELGVTGFPTEILFGLLAPAGTPSIVVEQLNQAVNESLNSGGVRASLAHLGMDIKIEKPQQFAKQLQEQARAWKAVIDATGMKFD